jgi:hypothetical protein
VDGTDQGRGRRWGVEGTEDEVGSGGDGAWDLEVFTGVGIGGVVIARWFRAVSSPLPVW